MIAREQYNENARQLDLVTSKAEVISYTQRSNTIEAKLRQARMQENEELTGRSQRSPLRGSKL
jgi:hypothetical protein